MEIRNRMPDVVKLRCNACQEFLKMVIKPNWQQRLYDIAKEATDRKKSYRKSTIHQSEPKNKGLAAGSCKWYVFIHHKHRNKGCGRNGCRRQCDYCHEVCSVCECNAEIVQGYDFGL